MSEAFSFVIAFSQSNPEDEVLLKRYTNGQYFGELALIQNKPRAASAFAEGSCTCAGESFVTFFCRLS